MINDALETFLFQFVVEKCKGKAYLIESTCSPYAVHVALEVRYGPLLLWGNIEIYDELNIWYIDAAGKIAGSNEGVDWANSEILYILVSLLHPLVTEDRGDLEPFILPIILKYSEEHLSKLLRVHEYDRPGSDSEGVVDLLDEVNLALCIAIAVKLMDIR